MKVALVDVDGVLADFVGEVRARLSAEFNCNIVIKYGHQDVMSTLGPKMRDWLEHYIRTSDFPMHLPIMDGSLQSIKKIRETHRVVFVTKPWYEASRWYFCRHRWLKFYFDAKDRDVIFVQDKFLIQGDVFIDDNPDNVTSWWAHQGKGIAIRHLDWDTTMDALERSGYDAKL